MSRNYHSKSSSRGDKDYHRDDNDGSRGDKDYHRDDNDGSRGDKDYHRDDNDRADNDCQKPSPPPSNDCEPDPQPNPQPNPPPVCDPSPPPVCDPSDQPGNDHHAALVSADVDADINVLGLINVEADVSASLLGGDHLLNLDADIDLGLGLWHA